MFGRKPSKLFDNDTKRYDLTKGYHRKVKFLTESERDDYRAQGWDVVLSDEAPGAGVLVHDMKQRYKDGSSKGRSTLPMIRWQNHLDAGPSKKSAGGRKTGNPYDSDRQIKICQKILDDRGNVVARRFFIVRQGDVEVKKESASV